ncbi:MAG: ParB/RepB/Spo0J family partition protein [Treponema sp.]|jgi:ParB/RepB/Spo0J family partition protein|nr:ParB/RepB/Spo0J family partition protein [Treponema sp.]
MKTEKLKLAGLRFSSNRAHGGEGDIQILAEDIRRNGIINPITVKAVREESGGGQAATVYEVVAGRRRVQAASLLGWKDIPSRILEGDEVGRAEEIAGSENINRMAMHPLDEAAVFHRLVESGRPIGELAKQYDRTVPAIWQRIQLLGLSDEIKAMFRDGSLSLHAAAMLKSLDEKGQQDFYKKFKDGFYVKKKKEIPTQEIRSFLSSRLNNKLFKFIVAKECEACQKRTFYNDKGLFPELNGAEDSCLDSGCYLKRWNALVAAKIKDCKKASPAHAGTAILAVDGGLKKWLGKNPVFDKVPYEIRTAGYGDTADRSGKNDAPCVRIELDWRGELKASARYWKHQAADIRRADSRHPKSDFTSMVELLDLPKAEAASAVQAFEENRDRLDPWDIGRKTREKTFWRLMGERAGRPPDKDEVATYLRNNVFGEMGTDKKKTFRLFYGKDYSTGVVPVLKSLPIEKLFFLMAAMKFDDGDLPSLNRFDIQNQAEKEFLAWLGTTRDAIKKIYREEIMALMPKAKPSGDAGKAGGENQAGPPGARECPKGETQ